MTTKMIAAIAAALILAATSAEARTRYNHIPAAPDRHDIRGYGVPQDNWQPTQSARVKAVKKKYKTVRRPVRYKKRFAVDGVDRSRSRSKVFAHHHEQAPGRAASISTQILPHPEGCPRTAFCGCGAALDIFKKHVRNLWLAANWFKFPKSEPGPGKVAVRNHHVFVIRQYLGNNKVLAYDANSGGHKTRLHIRSLAGYSVRDPMAGKMANL